MTAYSDLDSAVSAFQGGAFDYLPKPFDVPRAVELIRRARRGKPARGGQRHRRPQMPEILGQAPAMQDVFRAIGRLSQSVVTVLITGESGSGKELVANALHKHSARANGPFVAINTAAIPKDLLESELFGHERGAFTGAQTTRRGRFEQADGGTLFLDEIGDMPFDLQTRLLRVLSDGQFYRVGGHNPMKTSVRVIAATHQDLEERVKAGSFREDLFHRLNVIRLRLPALRERLEDIPPLTRFFLQKSARELGVDGKRITDAALAQLMRFDFPGNVRQLENICHWLTVMAPGQVVDVKDLPPEMQAAAPRRLDAGGAGPAGFEATAPDASEPALVVAGGASPGARPVRPVRPSTVRPVRVRCDRCNQCDRRVGTAAVAQRSGAGCPQPSRRRRTDGLGHAAAPVRSAAHPYRARDHAGPTHRGRAEARHRPQHDHAQNPGTRAGRLTGPARSRRHGPGSPRH